MADDTGQGPDCRCLRAGDAVIATYVARMNGWWWVLLTNDRAEVFDVAGPFDDEEDCEMARIRIERIAA